MVDICPAAKWQGRYLSLPQPFSLEFPTSLFVLIIPNVDLLYESCMASLLVHYSFFPSDSLNTQGSKFTVEMCNL